MSLTETQSRYEPMKSDSPGINYPGTPIVCCGDNCSSCDRDLPVAGYGETKQVNSDVDETLIERGSRYGEFKGHAKITQGIKRAMQDSPNWTDLSDDKKETLEMIAHKIGRILNGDPNYHDSWHDCIGYLRLVETTLLPEQQSA